ncbi:MULTISPECIES: tape measure protein [Klebsiella]|uniref:tape measure protein n=1 Tax=Klebsiella TaxID=570 RepID=UPI000B411600|nr:MULTISPECIES: tape measure protein [Klebsiella]HBQ6652315.1 tape measure protein [Klebsiella quasipneumoniae subsp. quasipneumoniae]OVX11276.1 tail tape measure protein [Klebsiella quasipneumoniae subsp. similipneumoniae]VGB85376.1 phage tail length tape-measure protein 1 [Klebsiella pneumoniae]GKP96150.1 hypothetical protein NUKP71_51560 [Klebsiella quasipneumoniae]HBT6083738.1 tape measure protein [Klebsiella quasipneumoniae]
MTTGFGDYTIEIEADVAKLLSGQRAADAALKQIETSVKRAGNSAEKLDKSLDKLGGGVSRLAVAVKGYISIQALMKLQQLSEEFTLLQARVTRLSSSTEAGARSFEQLVNIASATGASLGDTVNLWQQFSATLKTVGATNSDVNRLVMTLQKIGTIGGSSAQEMANALRQFMQSVASGRIQAEEFNSVLEQMPELARQIADGMGVPFNELRQLMLAGKLDIGEVLAAIEKRSDEINQQFEKMPRTVTQATNALVTQFGVAVSKIDDAIGASRYLAKFLDGAALSISVATGNAPDAVMLTQKLEQNTEQLAVAESDLAKARKAGLGWGVKQTEQTVERLKAERALILMAQQASKDSQNVYTPSKGETPAYITNLEKKTAENNANSIIKSGQTVVDKLNQQREQLSKDKAKGLIDDKKYVDAAAVLDKQIADARKKQDKPPKNAFARGDDSIDNLQRQIAVLTMRYDENTRESAQFNAVAALGAKATDAQKERVRELAGQLFDAQQRQKDLNDAISNDPLRKENKAYSDGREQLKRQLDGQMIDQKTYNQQSELMEQQHQVNLAKIRAQQVVTPQQQAAGEVDPVQRLANQHAQELALIQQFEQQKTITEQEALALRNAANNTYEKQRIEAQWEIFRNQSTTNELMAAAVDGFASQAASSMTGLINGTQSATEAFKNLGNAILNSVIQALVEVGIQYLKNAAMAMIADKMTSNSSQQAGAQTAAAWAPAAAAASIATFGGAAIAGIAGMVAAFAIGAALAGKRKNGGTVGAGGAYQVGEGNMPELLQTKNGLIMIPGDRGRVFSNKDVTGSSPTIQKASTGKEYLPTSSASSSQSGDSSKRPIQVNIQLIDQTTGSQHNITGVEAVQQGDVVTVSGFLEDMDRGGPMSSGMESLYGLRRRANGSF